MERKDLLISLIIALFLPALALGGTSDKPDEFQLESDKYYTFEFIGYPLRVWTKNGYVYTASSAYDRPKRFRIVKGLQSTGTNRTLLLSNRKVRMYYVDDLGLPANIVKIAIAPN